MVCQKLPQVLESDFDLHSAIELRIRFNKFNSHDIANSEKIYIFFNDICAVNITERLALDCDGKLRKIMKANYVSLKYQITVTKKVLGQGKFANSEKQRDLIKL